MDFICELDLSIYRAVTEEIASTEVIITEVQLRHIRERHPDIAGDLEGYLREAILHPDYILETDRPHTANVLKYFEVEGRGYQLVLRLKTSADPIGYKNSVIMFMTVSRKRWRQYLRNRRILYRNE